MDSYYDFDNETAKYDIYYSFDTSESVSSNVGLR